MHRPVSPVFWMPYPSCEAGGIIDPKAQLKIGDLGSGLGVGKLLDVMGEKKKTPRPKSEAHPEKAMFGV